LRSARKWRTDETITGQRNHAAEFLAGRGGGGDGGAVLRDGGRVVRARPGGTEQPAAPWFDWVWGDGTGQFERMCAASGCGGGGGL